MTTATDAPREGLGIGRVIQETFAVLGRNFPTFAVLALVLTVLPAAVAAYLQHEALGPSDSTTASVTKFLATLVPMVTGAVLQGAVAYATITDLNQRRAPIGEALAVGLRAFLPLLAIGILMTIAIVIGFILLIVPGLLMMVFWVVVTPAYVAERGGIAEAFGRSSELTEGNRWSVFGLIVVFCLLTGAGVLVLNALTGGILEGDAGSTLRTVVVSPLYSGVTTLLGSAGAATIYVELRRIREGASPEHLAAIFD